MAQVRFQKSIEVIVPEHFPLGSIRRDPSAQPLLKTRYRGKKWSFLNFDAEGFLKKNDFKESMLYRIKRPFKHGVVHEYWGLVIRGHCKYTQVPVESLWIVGFTNEDDMKFFETCWKKRSSSIPHASLMIHTENLSEFNDIKNSIQWILDHSFYRKRWVYLLAMVFTPIFGQPCSNIADAIEYKLRPFCLDAENYPVWI